MPSITSGTGASTGALGQKTKTCPFHDNKAPIIDYKNVRLMRKFLSSYAKILPRRRTGVCAKHQRQVSTELKKARFIGLVPYVQA
ncbi:MAG: 30S ribosomal protein S18 [Candidatus Andersenbacteria bacterium]